MSGGEALVKSLVREGVEVVFGIPGIQMYGIVAALRDEPGIRMVTTRHEQATTYMADGYARASGKPGAYGTDLHNPDFVKFAESFGAVGMRADDPLELETLIPLALEREAPVVIDVPFGDMPIPPAPQIAFVYNLPWTQPQDGLIQS